MQYKSLKRVTKSYSEIFTEKEETYEIHIKVKGIDIYIIEQQCGIPLQTPQINIHVPYKHCTYSMDLNTFLKRIIGEQK